MIKGKTKIQIYAISFLFNLPIYAALGFIAGASFGAWLKSWVIFWAFTIAIPIALIYRKTSKLIEKQNSTYKRLDKIVKNNMKKVDYYKIGEFGAIAIDAKSKEILIANSDSKFNIKKPAIFSAEKIRGYASHIPGQETITFGKTSFTTTLREIKAMGEVLSKTGIYFDIDDISNPQVFIQLDQQEIPSWILVLDKLFENSLEEQPTPMQLPQPAAA